MYCLFLIIYWKVEKYTEYELCVEIDNNSKICQYQEYCLKKNISQKSLFLNKAKTTSLE